MKAKAHTTAFTMLVAALLIAPGCGEQESGASSSSDGLQGKLVLTGSSTVAPLAGEIAKRYEKLHPDVRIDVQTGGSSRGIADAKRGTADIGMASRALKPEETDLAAHTVAMDGVGMILHRDNPVQSLTDEQVIAIYTGRVSNWSEVGGGDAPITVVSKADGRATLEVFLKHFDLASPDIRASVIIGDNQQGIRTVAGDVNAIGYVSVGTADFEIGRGVPIRLLPMDGVEATTANVRNGSFPMSRPLNLVTHGPVSPLAQAFIDFARSSAVNDLVKAQYFVPIAD
jgi:phosphate transport system substrate-binding protein